MAKNHAPRAISGRPTKAVNGRGLAPGVRAPVFRLPRDGGGTVELADFAGRKLVLYFYPPRRYQRLHPRGHRFFPARTRIQPRRDRYIGGFGGSGRGAGPIQIQAQARHCIGIGRGARGARSLWRLAAKDVVRSKIHGHRARHVSDRARSAHCPRLAQSVDCRPRAGSARSGKSALIESPMQIINRSSQIPRTIAVSISKLLTLIK